MSGWENGTQGNWRALRRLVIDRDGTVCRRCGKVTHERRCQPGGCPLCLQVGHVLAKALGGTDDPGNLRVECAGCNLLDGAKLGKRRQREAQRRRRAGIPTRAAAIDTPLLMVGVKPR